MAEEIKVYKVDVNEPEAPTGDAATGAAIGGVGGLVTGAIAGAAAGPVGAIIGAVVGGVVGAAASGAAVAAVDRYDDDDTFSGLPDDMSLDNVADREPTITDRSKPIPSRRLDDVPNASETPLGVGMPEAIAMSAPLNPSELASSGMPSPSGNSLTASEIVQDPSSDGGWERDNDANQVAVIPGNPTEVGNVDTSKPRTINQTFAYADNPDDDRRDRD